VSLSEDLKTITQARIALATVAPTVLVAEDAGRECEGQPVSRETVEAAAKLAQQAARPRTTMRGAASQRRHLVGVLTERALWGAIRRARGEEENGR
jgi:CO/xanthine dehydrogenase FAD-binding subunit